MGLIDRAMDRLKEDGHERPGTEAGWPEVESKGHAEGGDRVESFDDGASFEGGEAVEPLESIEPAELSAPVERTAPPLAVDADRIGRQGYLVGDSTNRTLLEEYRRIKRSLLFDMALSEREVGGEEVVRPANMIVITSSLDGEGKTFVASNLSFSIALEVDRTALLVDGDVFRRGATHLLSAEQRPGLVELLTGEVQDLADVILAPTGMPNLRFLPAGQPNANVSELLASQRMKRYMEELGSRYSDRVVVLDSPPLLITNEAAALSELVGQIALVVQADRTRQDEVDEALASIDTQRFSGFILNRAVSGPGDDYYGTYYPRD